MFAEGEGGLEAHHGVFAEGKGRNWKHNTVCRVSRMGEPCKDGMACLRRGRGGVWWLRGKMCPHSAGSVIHAPRTEVTV